ncbi:MAG: malate dehydrogenase [Cyanobacteria bacterium SZAS TMP-1]|nr:malate dehydrogenase [Cyanobacteria bacterium SZAS TMP-1]
MFKVAIIGAGNVGATAADYLAIKNLAHVVLVDINDGAARGKSLDLLQTGPLSLHSSPIQGSGSYEATAGSDIVVITAGVPRKEGMTRDDLLRINAQIVRSAATEALRYSPDAIFIVVTNPLDVMTQLTYQVTGLPSQKVLGMAGVLDSARFQTFIAMELGVSPVDVKAMVLGGHGDLMVPLLRHASVNGIPALELISPERMKELAARTRDGGAEIVKLLKTGSAYYAPGASIAVMVEAILRDENRLLPCSVFASGQHGLSGMYLGLPAVIGRSGVKRIIELPLNADEVKALAASAASIEQNVAAMNTLIGWGQEAPAATESAATKDAAPEK